MAVGLLNVLFGELSGQVFWPFSRAYCTAHGTRLSVVWQAGREGGLGEFCAQSLSSIGLGNHMDCSPPGSSVRG